MSSGEYIYWLIKIVVVVVVWVRFLI